MGRQHHFHNKEGLVETCLPATAKEAKTPPRNSVALLHSHHWFNPNVIHNSPDYTNVWEDHWLQPTILRGLIPNQSMLACTKDLYRPCTPWLPPFPKLSLWQITTRTTRHRNSFFLRVVATINQLSTHTLRLFNILQWQHLKHHLCSFFLQLCTFLFHLYIFFFPFFFLFIVHCHALMCVSVCVLCAFEYIL